MHEAKVEMDNMIFIDELRNSQHLSFGGNPVFTAVFDELLASCLEFGRCSK